MLNSPQVVGIATNEKVATPENVAEPRSVAKPGMELARREMARRHLVEFSEYIGTPWYRAEAHHRLAAEYLELVETFVRTKGRTGIGRLLILEPPRHGKSEQVSRMFPAWVLGRQPDVRVILTSYGADLATKHSRAAREIVTGSRYQAIFGNLATVDAPVEISADSRSVEAWDLAAPARGGMLAAGVGGAITGAGAHVLIVDDPMKNRDEAESEAQRERVWDWWTSTAYTRLEEGGAVIGMLTRWHGDDWAGRLIKAMASDPLADRWVVLSLPGLCEEVVTPEGRTFDEYQREKMLEGIWIEERDPLDRKAGEALWPKKYGAEDLKRIRVNVGLYDFEALYQQAPYLRSGEFFRRDWFAVVDTHPKAEDITRRVRYWDKAGTKTGTGGDFAVGVLMATTKDDGVYVEHVARAQCTPMAREEMILRTARDDANRAGPMARIWHQQDPGSAGLDSAQATSRMLARMGFTARFETVTGDKEVRAGPWSTACQGGHVRLMRGAWNQAFIEEHTAFPKGNHDDQVDAASGAFAKAVGRYKRTASSYEG